ALAESAFALGGRAGLPRDDAALWRLRGRCAGRVFRWALAGGTVARGAGVRGVVRERRLVCGARGFRRAAPRKDRRTFPHARRGDWRAFRERVDRGRDAAFPFFAKRR